MKRPLLASDLDECVGIFVDVFSQPPWNEVWDPAMVRERLGQILATPGFYGVVDVEDGIVAFAMGFAEPWHEGYHFYLKEMCVAPGFQRKGIGGSLMEHLSDELTVQGVTRIYLLTARGDIAESFYQKSGFYTSPKMILMARRLPQDDIAGA